MGSSPEKINTSSPVKNSSGSDSEPNGEEAAPAKRGRGRPPKGGVAKAPSGRGRGRPPKSAGTGTRSPIAKKAKPSGSRGRPAAAAPAASNGVNGGAESDSSDDNQNQGDSDYNDAGAKPAKKSASPAKKSGTGKRGRPKGTGVNKAKPAYVPSGKPRGRPPKAK